MKTQKSLARPDETSIASYVKRNASKVKMALRHRHEATASVREAEYKGHRIVIRTTYDIRIDGKPVAGHVGVTNDGQVHYHPVPNVSFSSAIDLVKQLIDIFPDDFTGRRGGRVTHGDHGIPVKRRTGSRSTKFRPRTKNIQKRT
jgi:hypothetical protein